MACTAGQPPDSLWGREPCRPRGYNLESHQFSSSPVIDLAAGSAGAFRDAGGVFGKREKAEEDRYLRGKSREQLVSLRKQHHEKIMHHEEIQRLQKEIERHKSNMKKLKDDHDD
ncbi:LOW QUALITY PROTEIN: ATPase inhibitor, mitochondrial-like [Dromiciops gliroides]|uniref:LOW QUALITY PROTEIN: ATPase inhibitor, mitochondrial-like n=1 Tax=Dromiciops gliroides TaxID=33562 RepID=UPI001CC58E75|nr:LOW QUALITY PROTEIN: ATPase inhibitor, mitochondrial-like [Dromiciops gliroides]